MSIQRYESKERVKLNAEQTFHHQLQMGNSLRTTNHIDYMLKSVANQVEIINPRLEVRDNENLLEQNKIRDFINKLTVRTIQAPSEYYSFEGQSSSRISQGVKESKCKVVCVKSTGAVYHFRLSEDGFDKQGITIRDALLVQLFEDTIKAGGSFHKVKSCDKNISTLQKQK